MFPKFTEKEVSQQKPQPDSGYLFILKGHSHLGVYSSLYKPCTFMSDEIDNSLVNNIHNNYALRFCKMKHNQHIAVQPRNVYAPLQHSVNM